MHKGTVDAIFRDIVAMLWQPLPPPPTKLGRYRILSPNAGIRVSPLQLGAMSVGDKWSQHMGSMDKESSFKLLDAFFEAGVCPHPSIDVLPLTTNPKF